ncbi:Na+/H+ antiporter [Labrys wisconsinensis]|uniref:CPA1 family monovalent cation:H+ antiporter n=1 Tax=Labrys wisconsinensis TaxID=425677 RepID=A0ABU0JGL4_9HYPH|nr:Na+/H+ antiporter [Labrys wisconsinensis]MDQ0473433.1 CPA1 family monovalent cation:H+ antiporter [Labrys wisconsinensis]
MDSIETVLILFLAVVASGAAGRMLPFAVPLPLVQIAIGALIASTMDLGVRLDPQVFFLLFLPPLLFLDGWRIPKDGLFRDAGTILELALSLVVFTVVGMGFFIHWMIPAMPLAVAFALAAVLAPTDPIAVSAIAARVPVPKRLMHILEGESLLNDASGLVCLRFAIAAALTGTFSAAEAVATFLWLAAGGLAIGTAIAWGVVRARGWLAIRYGSDPGSFILVSLLIPFAAYLAAEHLHCSGILAAVAAGFTMSFVENPVRLPAASRWRREAVWDLVQFAANGVIFILLGEQLPSIFAGAVETVRQTGHHEPIWLAVYAAAIMAVLAAGRFAWVWVSLRFTLFRARRRGETVIRPHLRVIAAASLAGAKGAITLAGILTLPLALADGSPFPARDLAIFLAATVIILSLAAASIGLPILLKGLILPPAEHGEAEEDAARVQAAEAAIRAIEHAQRAITADPSEADLQAQASLRVLTYYRERIDAGSADPDSAESTRLVRDVERRLFKVGLKAEREELVRLARQRRLGSEAVQKLIREADLAEARLGG